MDTEPSDATLRTYLRQAYYKTAFPLHEIYNRFICKNREVAFVNDGIWTRYLTFENEEEFRRAIEKSVPETIHIGAVFKTIPRQNREVIVEGKELVFDVDITDYNNVRTCCKGNSPFCPKCWKFCEIAARVINYLLREMFGYTKIMTVFSGGKGVHIWVFDKDVFKLGSFIRENITQFFCNKPFQLIKTNNTHIRDVYQKIIQPNAWSILVGDQKCSNVLAERTVRYKKYGEKAQMMAHLDLLWPRIDKRVTGDKDMKHLIKIPYSLHPKTNMISVPLDSTCLACPLFVPKDMVETVNHVKSTLKFIPVN